MGPTFYTSASKAGPSLHGVGAPKWRRGFVLLVSLEMPETTTPLFLHFPFSFWLVSLELP